MLEYVCKGIAMPLDVRIIKHTHKRKHVMNQYKSLVKAALKKGYAISVYDGEEWQVKRSRIYKAICDAVESVEASQMLIRDASGAKIGVAYVELDAAEPKTNVYNWTDNEEMHSLIG
jgi:hypothetical protein